MNPMREIRIDKVTLNIGAGKEKSELDKGISLLKTIGGKKPVQTITKKRIQEWGLRPGLPIGCKLTLRKEEAENLLRRLLEAKSNKLTGNEIDNMGNISFGISEYIDIPGVSYNPEIGIKGLQVCVTLERAGFRVKRRSIKKRKIPARHNIGKGEAIDFIEKKFDVKISP